ncbi:uncharacterized protein EDB91DRAFT_481315 [Suillus paluster]|uniref:uncharacterized protein n=1 Tax=Suillus paluster TaxID=48578 RepID=UPI001B868211|nr:uncharacterized protein EDB91DRAFT_481315 [Suillus paluster]KAG1737517.1 hypothetical protein EDB91DRAFT_481315 [Suillus paluster]
MFRFMGSESSGKGKQRQEDADQQVQVHIQTEVHSNPPDVERQDFQALGSTSSLPATPSNSKRPLPPGLRVPTHPYPYWHHHTPASSSQSSLESPSTPSQVSWLGGTGGSSVARAASSSAPNLLPHHFPPPPPTSPPANVPRPRSLNPSKSSHSLRVPAQEYFGQPLSPIVEQDYMSPEKRPVSLPSSNEGSGSQASGTTGIMLTPISPSMMTPTSAVTMFARTTPTPTTPVAPPQFARRREDELTGDSPRPSPVYSTFLSRPLNRSISMSSTRTHQSNNSLLATPPVIPPLDLRPAFPGPLPQDTLLSRDIDDEGLGILDDASKRESFVTARSAIAARESRYSAMVLDLDHELFNDQEDPSSQSAESSKHPPEHQQEIPQLPPAAHTQRPTSPTSTYPPSYSLPQPNVDYRTNHDGAHTPSQRDSVRSTSSSFIDRRFAESELYLGSHSECSDARRASDKWAKKTEKSDTARTLFWVGFIAPWCWLIGGWLVKAKKNDSYGRSGSMIPLWTGKSAQTVGSFKMQPLHHGYPFVAPSVQSLTPPSYSRAVHSRGPFLVARSPWIKRCRIAAGVSGIIIMLLFIAALVVVGRST